MQTKPHSSELLTSFIHSYNAEQSQLEQQEQMHEIYKANTQDQIAILESKLEAERRFTASLQDDAKKDAIELAAAEKAVSESLVIAKKQTALNREIESLKLEKARLNEQLKATQKKVSELNQMNPKKMKEQVKRLKEANENWQAKNKRLETDRSESKSKIAKYEQAIEKAANTISNLKVELDKNKGSVVYCNGDHIMRIWPDEIKVQREDGTYFSGRTLLYTHKSGRFALIAQDSDMKAHLCSAPKGGLKASKETLEFAERWLTQVNEVQDGIITDVDITPVIIK